MSSPHLPGISNLDHPGASFDPSFSYQGQQSFQAFPQYNGNGFHGPATLATETPSNNFGSAASYAPSAHFPLQAHPAGFISSSSSMPHLHHAGLDYMPAPQLGPQAWHERPDQAHGKRQLPCLHVHARSIGGESDCGSVASSLIFTPRMTALCGPGESLLLLTLANIPTWSAKLQ